MAAKTSSIFCALLGILLSLSSCNSAQRDATQAAINAAESAIDTTRAEAEKYAPEQLHAAEAALQSAKDALAKDDYHGALAAAQDAADKAKNLIISATSNKDEWTKEWSEFSGSMQKSLDQINTRINAYSHGARMPEGLDKDKLEAAKNQFEQLKKSWADATASANNGKLRDALDKLPTLKEMITKLKEMLGIKS
ncbi:MAG: hypothetical protein WBR26_27260 [Candidatus Acidiferrum sp.]